MNVNSIVVIKPTLWTPASIGEAVIDWSRRQVHHMNSEEVRGECRGAWFCISRTVTDMMHHEFLESIVEVCL